MTNETINLNGRQFQTVALDMSQYPLTAQTVKAIHEVHGRRGAMGHLYTRKNGSRWVLWYSTGRKARTEEILNAA